MKKLRGKIYTPDIKEKIGYIVRFIRHKKNISQKELAEILHLAHPEVSAIERASSKASPYNTSLVLNSLSINYEMATTPGCYTSLSAAITPGAVPDYAIKVASFAIDSYMAVLPDHDVEVVRIAGKEDYPECIAQIVKKMSDQDVDAIFEPLPEKIAQGMKPDNMDLLEVNFTLMLDRTVDPFRELCRRAGLAIPDYFGGIRQLEIAMHGVRFSALCDIDHAIDQVKNHVDDIFEIWNRQKNPA